MRTYTVTLRDKTVKFSEDELRDFADRYVSSSELRSRMSELIWLDMAVYEREFGVSPQDVLASILEVEGGHSGSGLKPADTFKNLPLKGLWHKHYFTAQFVPKNIQLALGKDGLEKIISDVMGPADGSPVTEEMIKKLAHHITHDPIEKREAENKLTGEWVVYLRRADKTTTFAATHIKRETKTSTIE